VRKRCDVRLEACLIDSIHSNANRPTEKGLCGQEWPSPARGWGSGAGYRQPKWPTDMVDVYAISSISLQVLAADGPP